MRSSNASAIHSAREPRGWPEALPSRRRASADDASTLPFAKERSGRERRIKGRRWRRTVCADQERDRGGQRDGALLRWGDPQIEEIGVRPRKLLHKIWHALTQRFNLVRLATRSFWPRRTIPRRPSAAASALRAPFAPARRRRFTSFHVGPTLSVSGNSVAALRQQSSIYAFVSVDAYRP